MPALSDMSFLMTSSLKNVNVIYLSALHRIAQELVKTCTCIKIELEFRVSVFVEVEENRRTWRKTLGAGTRTNNKLNPQCANILVIVLFILNITCHCKFLP